MPMPSKRNQNESIFPRKDVGNNFNHWLLAVVSDLKVATYSRDSPPNCGRLRGGHHFAHLC